MDAIATVHAPPHRMDAIATVHAPPHAPPHAPLCTRRTLPETWNPSFFVF
jgi:hypothetical protein